MLKCPDVKTCSQTWQNLLLSTTKEGVQQYLDFRKRDVELGHIVSGRLATIATHLYKCLINRIIAEQLRNNN